MTKRVLPILTLIPFRTSGSSGLYLKLTLFSLMSPLWGQSGLGLLDSMMAGASSLRFVYSKFLARELMKATKFALRFITKGIKVAVWKTLTITSPATAGGTCSCKFINTSILKEGLKKKLTFVTVGLGGSEEFLSINKTKTKKGLQNAMFSHLSL